MSVMYLVRHGQAGRPGEPYDKLSPLGIRQAKVLGEYWLTNGFEFDEVYRGTLKRQRLTEEAVGEIYREMGKHWPEAEVLEGLNEYSADEVMKHMIPELRQRNDSVRRLVEAHEAGETDVERMKNFQRLFEAVMRFWVSGEHGEPMFEPWSDFSDRVRRSMRHIMEKGGSGRRVAVFSSGGPIGVMVQSVLGAPDHSAMELNWRVRNCSLTELVFSQTRVSLESFNTQPHLTDVDLRSLR